MNTTTASIQSNITFIRTLDGLRLTMAVLGILVYVAGFLGNLLSLLVFIQKEFRQGSTSLIFLLLNIFSTIHLVSLSIEFLDSIFQVQIIASSIFRCQFTLWLQNTTRSVCAFLAATISIDRFIRSEYPMRSRIWCTTTNVLKAFYVFLTFSIVFYLFFYHPANVFDSEGQCSFPYDEKFRLYALNIMPPLRFVLVCFLPTILMVSCGIRMLFNIQQSKQRTVQPMAITTVNPPSKGSNTTEETRRKIARIDTMLVLMVLANVVAYGITQLPFNIYTLYYGYETSDDFSFYALLRAFLLMWSSIYFGIGFYLYCIASAQFRKQFIMKLTQICRPQPQPPLRS
mgnify:CR=1 FL=1